MFNLFFGVYVLYLMACPNVEAQLAGGYSAPEAVTQEQISKFRPMIIKQFAASATPLTGSTLQFLTVSKQIVAGTNYKFLIKAKDACWEIVVFEALPVYESTIEASKPVSVSCP